MYRRSGWYDPESSWKRYRIYARFRSEEVVEKGGRSRGKGKEVVEGSRAKGGYCPVQTCGTTRRGQGVARARDGGLLAPPEGNFPTRDRISFSA